MDNNVLDCVLQLISIYSYVCLSIAVQCFSIVWISTNEIIQIIMQETNCYVFLRLQCL